LAPLSAESRSLLEIADLLDLVCKTRREAGQAVSDEIELRAALFELLDGPTQQVWEQVRELALYPSNFPGLDTPSPLGFTVGDLAYDYGLGDVICPNRDQLLDMLRWGLKEHGNPTLNGNILA
jgi:hypothetical protein